ncbi:hypothetical protein [Nocardioides nitrophenolicus]|uniref:hypothetical protein n=1 Tax=Nocardioides nitrophenolicus TaxID=60489 RepID=UPI00195A9210|nr:hypothetical protein [Nocardioides nitrophenolicus]MBM7518292.1 hypothetical protein [Nocardioides nitrophenolicus]
MTDTTATAQAATPEDKPKDDCWNPPDNELGYLSEFIHKRTESDLDHHIACHLHETAFQHAHWSNDCKETHMFTDYPCDDYERGLHLGIAWLKSRITDLEQRA